MNELKIISTIPAKVEWDKEVALKDGLHFCYKKIEGMTEQYYKQGGVNELFYFYKISILPYRLIF
jgi:hypothetical protein